MLERQQRLLLKRIPTFYDMKYSYLLFGKIVDTHILVFRFITVHSFTICCTYILLSSRRGSLVFLSSVSTFVNKRLSSSEIETLPTFTLSLACIQRPPFIPISIETDKKSITNRNIKCQTTKDITHLLTSKINKTMSRNKRMLMHLSTSK